MKESERIVPLGNGLTALSLKDFEFVSGVEEEKTDVAADFLERGRFLVHGSYLREPAALCCRLQDTTPPEENRLDLP